MDRGHTSPSRRWTSTTTGSSPNTRWKQGLHCFCFPQQTFLTTSKWFKLNDMHVKALYASLSLTPGERVPEEGVWAPWLPSQRHSTREHGGGYLRQRGWEQRRLHILKRVHVQTRWTLAVLMQSASHFLISRWKYFGALECIANSLSGYLKVFQFYRNMFASCVTCELLCEDLFGTTGANKVFLISSFLWCFVFAGICVFCVFIFLRENLHIQYKATKCTFCGERDSLLLGFNTRSSNSDTLSLQLGSDAKQKPEDETQQSTIPFPGSYILLL